MPSDVWLCNSHQSVIIAYNLKTLVTWQRKRLEWIINRRAMIDRQRLNKAM